MKFAKLLFLVTFSFLSIGLNMATVRAEGSGYGYGYSSDCQAPYSRPDGTVGCGDTQPPSNPQDCAYTPVSGSGCSSNNPQSTPLDSNDPQLNPSDSALDVLWNHVGYVGPDVLKGAAEGFRQGGVREAAVGAAAGAAQSCARCHGN